MGDSTAPQMSSRRGQTVSLCGSLLLSWLPGHPINTQAQRLFLKRPLQRQPDRLHVSGPHALQLVGPQAGASGMQDSLLLSLQCGK